ncbi:MAG: nitroreductase family protein [Chloroflexi bacterium]|nr:nitroreductase family protein [Chloroflexota bacterium]MCL5275725.1 nitroreductase family protein [Chloroflexota bacterium]
MLDVIECIKQRRSIRTFLPRPVPRETLEKILQAAILAPSAGNWQSWRFYVVVNGALRRDLAKAASNQEFIAEAPVVIVVCAEPGRAENTYGDRARELYCLQDTAAAIENLMLAAHAHELGTCWVGDFDEAAVRRLLQIDEAYRPVALVPLGYPNETPNPRWRRPLSEVVEYLE